MRTVLLCVGVWLALAGFALQANRVKVRMPASLGDKFKGIARSGEVHEFIDFLAAYPTIKASTIVDAHDNSILHVLAQYNQAVMIAYTQVLDRNHHHIHIKNKHGIDPIELATKRGNVAAQRILTVVGRETDVLIDEIVDRVSSRAIKKAVHDGDESTTIILTEALVWKIATEDIEEKTSAITKALAAPLIAAISSHHNGIFDFLVDTAYPGYKDVETRVEQAVAVDNDHALQFFLKNTHVGNLTELLNAAAFWGSLKTARILAEDGADVRGSIEQVIRAAREPSNKGKDWPLQMLRLLNDYGAEVSRYQRRELEKHGFVVVLDNHSDNSLVEAH